MLSADFEKKAARSELPRIHHQLRNGQHRFDDALEETLPGVPTKIPPRATSVAPKREQRGQLQPSDVKLRGCTGCHDQRSSTGSTSA